MNSTGGPQVDHVFYEMTDRTKYPLIAHTHEKSKESIMTACSQASVSLIFFWLPTAHGGCTQSSFPFSTYHCHPQPAHRPLWPTAPQLPPLSHCGQQCAGVWNTQQQASVRLCTCRKMWHSDAWTTKRKKYLRIYKWYIDLLTEKKRHLLTRPFLGANDSTVLTWQAQISSWVIPTCCIPISITVKVLTWFLPQPCHHWVPQLLNTVGIQIIIHICTGTSEGLWNNRINIWPSIYIHMYLIYTLCVLCIYIQICVFTYTYIQAYVCMYECMYF